MAYTKNLFTKYGHDCTLDHLPDPYEYGDIPDLTCWDRFRRWLIRITVVCESTNSVHVHAHHLRSFGAIVNERKRQVLNYPNRIHPFSQAYTFWVSIINIVIICELIVTPLEFLLSIYPHTNIHSLGWDIFHLFLEFLLVANIVVTFFTGYYDEPNQEIVLDFRKIAIHYFKTMFIVDVFCILPVHVECFSAMPSALRGLLNLLGLLKYLLIIRFYRHCNIIIEKFNINFYVYMVAYVVIDTILFWHIVCCMLLFLRHKLGSAKSALFKAEKSIYTLYDEESKSETPRWNIFISAIYQGSHIIYNSSYGPRAPPTTEAEIILIWFAWYGSSLFFIYILAMIMVVMTARTSSAHKYVEMERQLKDYMRYKQLPMHMRQRILTYYGFRFQNSYFRENEILATISEQLRQEINMHACRKLVENVIFFRNLPLNLLVRIISCLRIEVYLVNDIIIRANTPGTSMYFISTGTVAIITKSGKEICHLEEGAHFGEVALIIKGMLRTASVVAVEVSEIYRLDQKDFVKAINPYPDLLANIQRIAAERMEVAAMFEDHNKRDI